MTDIPLEEVAEEFIVFREAFKTVLLSTATITAVPELSYAPYVRDQDGSYYIYISALAAHTGNIQNNPQVALLFIENETNTKNLFARRRLSYQCEATHVERGTEQWETVLDKFSNEFGNIMSVLRGLMDFSLYRLDPRQGTYVRGFSQAYQLTGDNMNELQHINPSRG
ncbi:MAG: pyridoxamine 5'-phosphate oxidase family protein [Gammaproteobacteria bacterium]